MEAKHRIKFSKTSIANLKPPKDKDRAYYFDERTPGFCCCVMASGRKTYYVTKWFEGKPVRHRIGLATELSVEEARRLALKAVGEMASGIDIAERRQQKRKEATLGEMFKQFLETYAKAHLKRWKAEERRYDQHLKVWSGRRLSKITKASIQELHQKVGESNGKVPANRLLTLISNTFTIGGPLVGWTGANPVRGIKKFREVDRDRFLDGDELRRFLEAVELEDREVMRDLLKMLLFVGARRANTQAMRWADINMELRTWRVPDEESKTGEALVIHLSQPAIEILERRRKIRGDDQWVFPGRSHVGHVTELKHIMKRVIARAGLSNVRAHDLRRTFASWQAINNSSLLIIGKSLGHRSTRATQVYARLQNSPVAASVDAATAAMLQAAKGTGSRTDSGK